MCMRNTSNKIIQDFYDSLIICTLSKFHKNKYQINADNYSRRNQSYIKIKIFIDKFKEVSANDNYIC